MNHDLPPRIARRPRRLFWPGESDIISLMNIDWIKSKVESGDYEFTGHAEEERQADKILIEEIENVLIRGAIIEDYPGDPRGHSCLVSGYGNEGIPIHVVCGITKGENLRIITVYIPTLPKWKDPKTRG